MGKYSIETISEFFGFCHNEIEFGWIDQKGTRHESINDGKTYYLQSPEELMISRLGICWDRAELYRDYFKSMTNLKYETYFLFYDDGQGCPSHSILVFYKDNKVYWFEPMFQNKVYNYSGIREYDSITDLLNDFKNKWIEIAILNQFIPEDYNEDKLFIYRYDTPEYHINGYAMKDHIDDSELIMHGKILKRS